MVTTEKVKGFFELSNLLLCELVGHCGKSWKGKVRGGNRCELHTGMVPQASNCQQEWEDVESNMHHAQIKHATEGVSIRILS